jgi:heterodisulfide reductase subunit A-like polyferredoxin
LVALLINASIPNNENNMKLEKDLNLTSGSLYRPTLPQAPSYRSLQTSEQCDVAILGGGITAALLTYHLAEAGIDPVLVEKRTIGAGSTSASKALLQYELDTHLLDLKQKVGLHQAIRVYEPCLEAIAKIKQRGKNLTQGCNFLRI